MTIAEHRIVSWPSAAPLPPAGEPLLIRVPIAPPRQRARRDVRGVLRQLLATWSGEIPASLSLRETPRGPVCDRDLAGHSVRFSVSYSESEAWIAVLRGGGIGVDAMLPTDFSELESVARLYLGPAVCRRIQQSADRARAFALAWTELEARSKLLNQPIVELVAGQDRPSDAVLNVSHYQGTHTVVTVVTAGSD